MNICINATVLGGSADSSNLTGSCILLSIRRGKQLSQFLLGAGLWQGDFKNSIKKNKDILKHLDLDGVKSIILDHLHVDHIGRAPLFIKEGFKGNIICTEPTCQMLKTMLMDSAHIQEIEASYLRKKAFKKAQKNSKGRKNKKDYSIKPLYTPNDVSKTIDHVKNGGFGYKQRIKLDTGIYLIFYPSGHVLGGAICVIEVQRPKATQHVYIGFSSDLGRKDGIILPPPELIEEPINYWFVESTYGDRIHPDRQEEIKKLCRLVRDAKNKNKKIIIPSFALERTQEIIYLLSYFMSKLEIPSIPIYIDSPLAKELTNHFAAHWDNKELFSDQGMLNFNPFEIEGDENPHLEAVIDQKHSDLLANKSGPHIVIAGAGSCDAGRVRNHLKKNLSNYKTIVCLVGWMPKDSLGGKLKEGFPIVRMNKKDIDVNAEIISFESFSAHADYPFLVEYTKSIINPKPHANRKILIVHGEEKSGLSLKRHLINALPGDNWKENIIIPAINKTIKLQ